MQTQLQNQIEPLFEQYFKYPKNFSTNLITIEQNIKNILDQISDPQNTFLIDLSFSFQEKQKLFFKKHKQFLPIPKPLSLLSLGYFDLPKIPHFYTFSMGELDKKSKTNDFFQNIFLSSDEQKLINQKIQKEYQKIEQIYDYLFDNYVEEFKNFSKLSARNKQNLSLILAINLQEYKALEILAHLTILNAFLKSQYNFKIDDYSYKKEKETQIKAGALIFSSKFLFATCFQKKAKEHSINLEMFSNISGKSKQMELNFIKIKENNRFAPFLKNIKLSQLIEDFQKRNSLIKFKGFEHYELKEILENHFFKKFDVKNGKNVVSVSFYNFKEEYANDHYKKHQKPVMHNVAFAILYNLWQNSLCKFAIGDRDNINDTKTIQQIINKEAIWREQNYLSNIHTQNKNKNVVL